jgi:RNA 3'-terminal phosphate cyclase (ATP)
MTMIEIDGSEGEGGGQVLRTALSLSVVTGKPFRLYNIRANRPKPGLQKQHLACVQAAAKISDSHARGAALGSRELLFEPGQAKPGNYHFRIDSAGSTGLVLQTVLYPLLLADGESRVSIQGGTHNAWAPPLDFLQLAFLPTAERVGIRASLRAERLGFYPAGGGLVHATIQPWTQPAWLALEERGAVSLTAVAYVANLPEHIAQRELKVVRRQLQPSHESIEVPSADGPGNAICIYAKSPQLTDVFTAFGKRGYPAEAVAKQAVREVKTYLNEQVPVGPHLADQLLLPLALGAGGRFLTTHPTPHTATNARIIRLFLPVEIDIAKRNRGWLIAVGRE